MRNTTKLLVLALTAAVLDYAVRSTDGAWTGLSIFQWVVFLSPIIYVALLTNLLLKFDRLFIQLPANVSNIAAVILCIYLIVVLVQVFTNGVPVGSAWYSVVHPLYVSGIPASALTLAVFLVSVQIKEQKRSLLLYVCSGY